MSTAKKRSLTIYIHPDKGPITPMKLDLDAVEVAINKVPTASSSDEAAVRAIVKQISDKFKGLEPENNSRQLAMIMRRWVYAEGFIGIVLRLTGTITNKEAGMTSVDASQLISATSALENEQRAHAALKLRVQGLETERKRLKSLYEQAKNELNNKRIQEQQMQKRMQQNQIAMQQSREDADQAMQDVATLKLQIEQMQTQLRSQAHYEQELAQLRQQERSARQSEQQVRESLAQLQQDYIALQDEIRRLTEGSFLEEAEMDTDDPYSLDYM